MRLADQRLNSRYRVVLDRLSSKPTSSIPAACDGWAETQAAYRFFDNDRITPEQLLQPHYGATLERIRQHPVVLIAQDTTEFDLTRRGRKSAARWATTSIGACTTTWLGRDAPTAGTRRRV